jgi:hypothetical protein
MRKMLSPEATQLLLDEVWSEGRGPFFSNPKDAPRSIFTAALIRWNEVCREPSEFFNRRYAGSVILTRRHENGQEESENLEYSYAFALQP